MWLLYGRAGRLTVQNCGFWPGQVMLAAIQPRGCLERLASNEFGNGIIQHLIERCDTAQLKHLGLRIEHHANTTANDLGASWLRMCLQRKNMEME
jgi:hypothetical protein